MRSQRMPSRVPCGKVFSRSERIPRLGPRSSAISWMRFGRGPTHSSADRQWSRCGCGPAPRASHLNKNPTPEALPLARSTQPRGPLRRIRTRPWSGLEKHGDDGAMTRTETPDEGVHQRARKPGNVQLDGKIRVTQKAVCPVLAAPARSLYEEIRNGPIPRRGARK